MLANTAKMGVLILCLGLVQCEVAQRADVKTEVVGTSHDPSGSNTALPDNGPRRTGGCPATCYSHTCDHWVPDGYSCSALESEYSCDCTGCSCGGCVDQSSQCPEYVQSYDCNTQYNIHGVYEYLHVFCPASCGTCAPTRTPTPIPAPTPTPTPTPVGSVQDHVVASPAGSNTVLPDNSPRRTGFVMQTSGTCASPITSAAACQVAATTMQYQGRSLQWGSSGEYGSSYPSGCFIYGSTRVYFDDDGGASCSGGVPCICKPAAGNEFLPGMIAWYKSSSLKVGSNGAWQSSVGSFVANINSGSLTVQNGGGNGATAAVLSVKGNTATQVDFGNIVPSVFTVCSLTRYTGGTKRRILNAQNNWLHGHWNGMTGVAFYEGWKTGTNNRINPNTNWVAMCGQNGAPNLKLVNGASVGTSPGGGGGGNLYINKGGCCGGETSDFAVAEVMTWGRALSSEEINKASAYLADMLVKGTKSGGCPSTCYGHTCDQWSTDGYSCSVLESNHGCDCTGCSCGGGSGNGGGSDGRGACDASAAPAHGTKGDCTATLASGSSCQPICNAGFTASGTSSCSAGTLTAATCAPNGQYEIERDALLKLYHNTNGPGWRQKWDITSSDHCSWYGVTCTSGVVTKLNLSGNELTGPIPAELGKLTSCTALNLSGNWLSGPIPAELGKLTSLTDLRLSDNNLTGPIPAELGKLTSCTNLRLYGNRLSGPIPAELGKLTSLKYLLLGSQRGKGFCGAELPCPSSSYGCGEWTGRMPGRECACDASVAPPGGTVGDCPSQLAADQTCTTTCGPHAHPEGVTSCDGSNAKLIQAQCVCNAGSTGSPSEGCTPCPAGTYGAGGDSSCTPCPGGTLSVMEGATSSDVCSKCDKPGSWPPTRRTLVWLGANRTKPLLSYQRGGNLLIAVCTEAPLTSFVEFVYNPTGELSEAKNIWQSTGPIMCYMYTNATGKLTEAPLAICNSTVSIERPYSLTVKLCALRSCIPAHTLLQLRCTSNLATNEPGEVNFAVSNTLSRDPITGSGYKVLPDSIPTSPTWIGAARDGSYVVGEEGKNLNIRLRPSRPLSPGGTIYITPDQKLYTHNGFVNCSVSVEGNIYKANAIALAGPPYMLQVQPLHQPAAIKSEIQLVCSGPNLARNGLTPGLISFTLSTTNDTVPLQNQSGYTLLPSPKPPAPLPKSYTIPIPSDVLNQGSCGSCYAFAAVTMSTDRLNQWGLPGLGKSSFPQSGCESCVAHGCNKWCKESKNLFGWCQNPNATSPAQCCACSTPGLGGKVLSPGHMVQCDQDPLAWVPQSNTVLHAAAEAWVANDMGGCDGGMPLLAIAFMQDRGVGTCDQSTGCATGCVPYPFVPEGHGAQSSAPRPIIWHAAQDAKAINPLKKGACGNVEQGGIQNTRRNAKGKIRIEEEKDVHVIRGRRSGCVGKGRRCAPAPPPCPSSHTGTLSSQCPFWCMKRDEEGNCLQYNEGSCRDTGNDIYHYHNLQPVWLEVTDANGEQLPYGSTVYGSTVMFQLSNTSMNAIMRELWEHGPITAVIAIYQDPSKPQSELAGIMLSGNVYLDNPLLAIIHGFHAVVIVGWGVTVGGVLYWKVKNSWGKSQTVLTFQGTNSMQSTQHEYPEEGYFQMIRGVNFCGIESSLVYASAVKNLHANQQLQPALINATIRSKAVAGGWYELPADETHIGVSAAANHLKEQAHQEGARRTGQPLLHHHVVTKVMHQVVAGSNYHIVMDAKNAETGESYEMQGIIHQNLAGEHSVTYRGNPRKKLAAQGITQSADAATSTPATGPTPEVQAGANTADSIDNSKASTTAAGIQAVPQGATESSDKVHVPTWAIWLTGAVITMLIAVIIGLIYILSTKRRRPVSGVVVKLDDHESAEPNKAVDQRPRATSLEVIEVAEAATATLKASSQRSSTSTEVRSRSASREGVLCLD